MRYFGRYLFASLKDEKSGILFDKGLNQFEIMKTSKSHVIFYFEDYQLKTSPIDKVLLDYPFLNDYSYVYKDNFGSNVKAISNLDQYWQFSNQNYSQEFNDFTLLRNIAYKIPKPYNFFYSFFIFDKLDWFDDGIVGNPTTDSLTKKVHPTFPFSYLSPSILVWNDNFNGKRYFSIWAIIELTNLYNSQISKSKIDSIVREKISFFGKIRRKEIINIVD